MAVIGRPLPSWKFHATTPPMCPLIIDLARHTLMRSIGSFNDHPDFASQIYSNSPEAPYQTHAYWEWIELLARADTRPQAAPRQSRYLLTQYKAPAQGRCDMWGLDSHFAEEDGLEGSRGDDDVCHYEAKCFGEVNLLRRPIFCLTQSEIWDENRNHQFCGSNCLLSFILVGYLLNIRRTSHIRPTFR